MNIESIRRRTAILLFLGMASIFVLGASILPSAQADKQFTNKSIEGTWVISASGTIIGVGPAVAVGLIMADGKGVCSAKQTLNIADIVNFTQTSTACTYNVNPDGTGTATVTFNEPFGGDVNLSFVIVNKASEIQFIRTDKGFVFSGVVKRQSRGDS